MIWLLIGIVILTSAMFLKSKWINLILAVGLFAVYFDVLNQPKLNFLIFLLGVLFLIIELYVPDFGFMGILGFLTIIYSLYEKIGNLSELVILIISLISVVVLVIIIGLKLGYSLAIGPQLILQKSLNKASVSPKNEFNSKLINWEGTVVEDLRPVGKVKFLQDNEVREVISHDGMIGINEHVYVYQVSGNQLYVRKK